MANLELAALLADDEEPTKALEYVGRALATKPDSDEARLLHAKLLTQQDDPDYAYAILVELSEPGVRPLVRGEALSMTAFRSGTNLIGSLLDRQPAIAVANHITAFADDIFPAALMAGDEDEKSRSTELFRTMDDARRQKEAIRYRELLLQCLPDRDAQPEVLIDHSPATIHLIPSFLRIVPKGKIIVSIRDPRDVLVSSLFAHFAPERNTVAQDSVGRWQHYEEPLAAYYNELEPLIKPLGYE